MGTKRPFPTVLEPLRDVQTKVHSLQGDGTWLERGVGGLSVTQTCVTVVGEKNKVVARHVLSTDNLYYPQADGLQVRLDPDHGVESVGSLMLCFRAASHTQAFLLELAAVLDTFAAGEAGGSSSSSSGMFGSACVVGLHSGSEDGAASFERHTTLLVGDSPPEDPDCDDEAAAAAGGGTASSPPSAPPPLKRARRGPVVSPPPSPVGCFPTAGAAHVAAAAAAAATGAGTDAYLVCPENVGATLPLGAAAAAAAPSSTPPPLSLRALEAVLGVMQHGGNLACEERCEAIAEHLLRHDFSGRALGFYVAVDSVDDAQALRLVACAVATVFTSPQLFSAPLLRSFLTEENLYDTICSLEHASCHVAVAGGGEAGGRGILPRRSYEAALHAVSFRNPLRLGGELQAAAQRAHHLAFLRDSVLPLSLSEAAAATITALAQESRLELAAHVLESPDALAAALSECLRGGGDAAGAAEAAAAAARRAKAAEDLCKLSVELLGILTPLERRAARVMPLLSHGVGEALLEAAADLPGNAVVVQAVGEALRQLLILDTTATRDWLLTREELRRMFARATLGGGGSGDAADAGVRGLWQEVALMAVETQGQRERFRHIAENTPVCAEQSGTFRRLLYGDASSSPMNELLRPFDAIIAGSGDSDDDDDGCGGGSGDDASSDAFLSAATVLSACIQSHAPREVAEWLAAQGVAQKLSAVVRAVLGSGYGDDEASAGAASPPVLSGAGKAARSNVCLGCVWVTRAMVTCVDKGLHASLVELDPFSPLLRLCVERGLLGSAGLSLFNQIWTLNREGVVSLVATRNRAFLLGLQGRTQVGEHFLLRHEKNVEGGGSLERLPSTPHCGGSTTEEDVTPLLRRDGSVHGVRALPSFEDD